MIVRHIIRRASSQVYIQVESLPAFFYSFSLIYGNWSSITFSFGLPTAFQKLFMGSNLERLDGCPILAYNIGSDSFSLPVKSVGITFFIS